MHDSFVGSIPKTGNEIADAAIDVVANVPSMPVVYVTSVTVNNIDTVADVAGSVLSAINPFD